MQYSQSGASARRSTRMLTQQLTMAPNTRSPERTPMMVSGRAGAQRSLGTLAPKGGEIRLFQACSGEHRREGVVVGSGRRGHVNGKSIGSSSSTGMGGITGIGSVSMVAG